MALNKFMHKRNPFYNNPPDFRQLARLYPDFEKHCILTDEKCEIDFKNPEALKALACVLLKHLFNLNVDIPVNHLIPRIPQRINYVLWIEDLLKKTDKANGIDIGCGCSCVYSLIACSLNKDWSFVVSDINEQSLEWANKNIKANNLDKNIKAYKVEPRTVLLELLEKHDSNKEVNDLVNDFDFLMCNPPFYANESDIPPEFSSETRKPSKRHMAKSVNTAHICESVFEKDGEVGFVKKIIDESITTGKRIKVYTTMLGKKKSLIEVKKYLKDKNILNVTETQFCQGHTMRWGIAWSFLEEELQHFNYMKTDELQNSKKIKPINYDFPRACFKEQDYSLQFIFTKVEKLFSNKLWFKVIKKDENNFQAHFNVFENTWSKQRIKRRKGINLKIDLKASDESGSESNDETSLCHFKGSEIETNQKSEVNIRSSPILKFEFRIKFKPNSNNQIVMIEINSEDIFLSHVRENLNQILQYLKNNIYK